MPRERLPLKRKVRNKDITIDISSIFRNTDIQDEVIREIKKFKSNKKK